MANQFDPIQYSDWDAIQSIIYAQLGPLQEIAGSPGVFVEGTGYGLAEADLQSRAYPFSRDIDTISSEAQATVTFTNDHHLVVDEVIFFTNFNNAWGGLGIQNNFAKVITIIDATRVIVDFNTFSYPAWQIGDSAESVQYYISANQFVNLRADLAKVVQHITGAPPAQGNNFVSGESTQLPVPIRGDIIYHSVYDPYYTVSNAADANKFLNLESTTYEATMPGSASNTTNWNGLTEYEIKITWPGSDGYNFVQFFNTGGLIKIDMLNVSESNPDGDTGGQNNEKLNNAWEDLLTSSFPIYLGAKGKAQMGLASDPRSFATSGAYDLNAAYAEVFYNEYGSNPYDDSYDDHYVQIEARSQIFQRDLTIKVTLSDSSTTNTYANRIDIDRKLQISFIYSIGSVPLAETPNQYTVQRVSGWS